MTSDLTLKAIRAHIQAHASAELALLDIYIDGDQFEILPPFLDLTITGSKEHEVLRGVIEFSVQARIATVPRSSDGTSTDITSAMSDQLYDILGGYETIVSWSDTNITDLRIFHVGDYGMETTADNDITISMITFTVTSCKL